MSMEIKISRYFASFLHISTSFQYERDSILQFPVEIAWRGCFWSMWNRRLLCVLYGDADAVYGCNQNDCQRVKATHRLIPAGINLQILLFRVTKNLKFQFMATENSK